MNLDDEVILPEKVAKLNKKQNDMLCCLIYTVYLFGFSYTYPLARFPELSNKSFKALLHNKGPSVHVAPHENNPHPCYLQSLIMCLNTRVYACTHTNALEEV